VRVVDTSCNVLLRLISFYNVFLLQSIALCVDCLFCHVVHYLQFSLDNFNSLRLPAFKSRDKRNKKPIIVLNSIALDDILLRTGIANISAMTLRLLLYWQQYHMKLRNCIIMDFISCFVCGQCRHADKRCA